MRKPHRGEEQQEGNQQPHDNDPRPQRVRPGRSFPRVGSCWGTRCRREANLGWRYSCGALGARGRVFPRLKNLAGFLFPVWVGIARGERSRKQCFPRYVRFATHVKLCACCEEFFLDGETWPSFLFPVLVGIARGRGVQ